MQTEQQVIGVEDIDWTEIERNDRKLRRLEARQASMFFLPALIVVVVVLLVPVAMNIYFSFTKWQKFSGMDEFAGIGNYQKLLDGNPFFQEALYNTVIWVVASLALPMLLGLLLALLLREAKGSEFIKSVIFLPKVLAPTVVGIIWFYVYAPDGVLNYFLGWVSNQETDHGWLYSGETVTSSIIMTFVWQNVGIVMVMLLIGLGALPKDPLEAAKMDGASPVQIFRHIILPLLTPTILNVTIISVLMGFTAFDLLWVMGTSFPGQKSLSLAVQMYFEAFQKGNWAIGSALAIMIGLTALLVTWVQILLQQRAEQITQKG